MGCGSCDAPPAFRSRSCELVHLLDGDVPGRIVVQRLDHWLNVHEIDVFECPGIVLVDTPMRPIPVDLEDMLFKSIFLLLQIIIVDC